MTDGTQTSTTAPTKKQIAVRDWIDPDGNPVNTGEESKAVGPRYIHLPTAKRLQPNYNPESDAPPPGAVFDKVFPAVGEPMTVGALQYAIFGAHTLWGNVVNSATNGPKGDPDADVIPLIAERDADIEKGIWADRATGVGGVRYDKEKLAAAIAKAKGESDPAPYLAKMEGKVDPKTGATVAADTKGAISYGAFALRNARVKDAYDALTGGGTKLDVL
jgi:hypothetical protein